jgi:hypothetical protein
MAMSLKAAFGGAARGVARNHARCMSSLPVMKATGEVGTAEFKVQTE